MQPPTLPPKPKRDDNWPGAIMFIAFLAFVYLMTGLFVR